MMMMMMMKLVTVLCSDVDECAQDNRLCEHDCMNQLGRTAVSAALDTPSLQICTTAQV